MNYSLDYFLDKVEKTSTCWFWTGARWLKYGKFFCKDINGKLKQKQAHRVSYELFCGEIPKGMCVLHICDVPHCVNPNHLRIGSQKENNEDRSKKGRSYHKLSESQICDIRKMYPEFTYRQIAKIFNVTHRSIMEIIRKNHYKHI